MRKWLVILCVVAQVSVLAFMVGGREMIIRSGNLIYLRTAPLDPRDIFRGDFVRLDYTFNEVSSRNTENFTAPQKGQMVYASLQAEPGGVYAFAGLSAARPDSGVFIRGRITRNNEWAEGGTLRVKYGIEQYFVEQGSGFAIEEKRGRRGGMQVPMEVAIAVSKKGVAVLKDYRWSALGLQIEFLPNEIEEPAGQNAQTAAVWRSPVLKVTLENVSQSPQRLDNPGDNCGFTLVADQRARQAFTAVENSCMQSVPDSESSESIVTLAPGEQYSVELDLSAPRFHLSSRNEADEEITGEIAAFPGNPSFRIVYQSPTADVTDETDSWSGRLPSQAFSAGGRID